MGVALPTFLHHGTTAVPPPLLAGPLLFNFDAGRRVRCHHPEIKTENSPSNCWCHFPPRLLVLEPLVTSGVRWRVDEERMSQSSMAQKLGFLL